MSSTPESPNGDLAAKVSGPQYAVTMLTDRHFIVAGGGGAAKTGVTNGFTILELSFNGTQCVANEVGKEDTECWSVMNCASYEEPKSKKQYFVAGLDDCSQLYYIATKFEVARSLSYSDQNDNDKSPEKLLRQRKPSEKESANGCSAGGIDDSHLRKGPLSPRRLRLFARKMEKIQTDISNDANSQPFQKVVRISSHGRLMATGGCDGQIRLWQFPTLAALKKIEAHKKEVDDLDFSPDSQRIVSVSKDGSAFVWSVKDGKKVSSLEWVPPDNVKYLFKRCRFSPGEGDRLKARLFTIVNPIGTYKCPSYLQLWDASSLLLVKSVAHKSTLSALSTSRCGKFVAVGSMFGGCVHIYTAFNLMLIKRVENAHSNFITGLEFVPCHTATGQNITGQSDAAVISISIDSQVRVHRVPRRRGVLPLWLAVLLLVVSVTAAFILCSYLGL